jgi:hypothetical protein
MAYFQRGDTAAAKQHLQEGLDLMDQPDWSSNYGMQQFRDEAVRLIAPDSEGTD